MTRQTANPDPSPQPASPPNVDDIMAYEDGRLDTDETLALFQRLVDSGMAWQLQGSYGRTAAELIRRGLVIQH